jgi:hypothetical protein
MSVELPHSYCWLRVPVILSDVEGMSCPQVAISFVRPSAANA